MSTIIKGRKEELQVLEKIWKSKNAELLAIYGRRRIGKTFLVREFFRSKGHYFELAGKKDSSIKEQLQNFADAFSKVFHPDLKLMPPNHWREALELLTKKVEKTPSQKFLLFFDELPWLAAKKSKFIQALDYFWNTYWNQMPNVKVVLCGSAASWMLENLIHAKGGLHNRITRKMHLKPFSLKEVKEYLASRKVRLNEKQVLDLYMVMGGVPYYLNYVEAGKSAEQTIQDICFKTNGPLLTEFEQLFQSLFDAADVNLRIVKEIAAKKEGISREELLTKLSFSSGGRFNKRIQELEAAGFIQGFVPYGRKKKEQYFRIIDEYSSFYLFWIDPIAKKGFAQPNYWKSCLRSPKWAAWAGQAFESICFKHLAQIIKALDLSSIPCEVSSWRFVPKKGSKEAGAQIDLLFDRQDNIVTLCEIKYSSNKYGIDKSYAKDLHNKIDVFKRKTQSNKDLFISFITTMGLKKGLWSEDLVDGEVHLKDLFGS